MSSAPEPRSDLEETVGSDLRSTASDELLRELADTGSAPPIVELESGSRIDRFRIEGVIGRGGMGVVYDAHDERLDRRVALKVLHPHLVGHAERRTRFSREAKAAAAVDHPNVARILEVGDGESGAYLVFEKVEGRTLRSAVRAGSLPIDRLVEMGVQIASGLASAHASGIVHRDLKPENIVLDAAGVVKILDFGLAKTSRDEDAVGAEGEVLTREGIVLGSPGYMSPEQALGKPTSRASDVFSLGVVLFELATGVRPFKGGTAMESIVATTRDRAPDPTTLRRDLPRAFGRLVERCLAKDPEQRPSARDVADSLLACRDRERSPLARRGPWIALAGSIALLGGLALRRAPAEGPKPGDRVVSEPNASVVVPPSPASVRSAALSATSEPTLAPSALVTARAIASAAGPSRVEASSARGSAAGVPRGSTAATAMATAAAAPQPIAPSPSRSDEPSFAERK
ncbi:MAG: protein kinase [Deltaproteobacteria bacterium]|nr:protein kinase [Deltaproteobacteria bacterium]